MLSSFQKNKCASSTIRASCTTICDKVCQWLATGRWFSKGSTISSTNKTDHHDIAEILLKVALNTIKQTNDVLNVSFYIILNIKPYSRSNFHNIGAQYTQ
jgi:hypothetical protein